MPVISATGKQRRKVRFSNTRTSKTTLQPSSSSSNASAQSSSPVLPAASRSQSNPVSRSSTSATTMAATPRPGVPALFSEPPVISDPITTETMELQKETLDKCLPYLKGIQKSQRGPFNRHGVPALQRDDHAGYLYDSLEEYPEGFVALDASRPWMSYWALAGLSLLGEDVTKFRQR